MKKLYRTIVCALCGQAIQVTEDELEQTSNIISDSVTLKNAVVCPHCLINKFRSTPENKK